jgi:hypothetical protein
MLVRFTSALAVAVFLTQQVISMKIDSTPIDPITPARLAKHKDVQPLLAGFVDPTLPPYSAAGDGMADDSTALQQAIDDAYVVKMTVLLPANRTFLLSTQLRMIQPLNTTGRSFGFQIVAGSGVSGARPVLKLRDGASTSSWVGMPNTGTEPEGGQGNCLPSEEDCTPKVFLLFQYLESRATRSDKLRAETFYLCKLRGIDVDVGNNPGVSAVSMSSAQLASIEDVRVTGLSFHAGFNGLPGSGGFSANLQVTGGEYGVVQNQFRPNPSIVGLRLVGQNKAGVVVDVSRGPVVVSGFHIEGMEQPTIGYTAAYRAVLLRNRTDDLAGKSSGGGNNAFNGEDGIIVMHGASGGTAIESIGGSNVILKNVYLSGVRTIAVCLKSGLSLLSGGSVADPGPPTRVPLLVLTASAGGQILDKGRRPAANDSSAALWLPTPLEPGAKPPWAVGSMPLLHSWNYVALPTPDAPGGVLNVMTQYGATPEWVDATDDDGVKIQQAIDDSCDASKINTFGRPVFLPHGQFGLARPLDLRGCAQLIGAGTHSAELVTLPTGGKRCWPEVGLVGAMLVSTSNALAASESKTAHAGRELGLVSDFNLLGPVQCPFMDLQAGKLLLRDIGVRFGHIASVAAQEAEASFSPPAPAPASAPGMGIGESPFIALRNAVSGRFYGLPLDGIFGGTGPTWPPGAPLHVLILVEGCKRGGGSIDIYQASTEHFVNFYQSLVANSTCGVSFHAWKYESSLNEKSSVPPRGSGSVVKIEQSDGVSVFGASGNYRLFNTSVPMVDIVQSKNVSIAGMVRKDGGHGEPATGLKWLVDEDGWPGDPGKPMSIGAYKPLLLYRSPPPKAGRGGIA